MCGYGDCIRGPLVDSTMCHACGGMMRSVHDSSCIGRGSASRWLVQCGKVGVLGVEVTQGWVWTWVVLRGSISLHVGFGTWYCGMGTLCHVISLAVAC
jgi:hypothetical protein